MDKITVGVIIGLAGLISFLQSFSLEGTAQYVYFIVGLILLIGGAIYAAKQIKH